MNPKEGRQRVVISQVTPQVEEGRFAIKRVIGDEVIVRADIFTDGFYVIAADLLFCSHEKKQWQKIPMALEHNDRWKAQFSVPSLGVYFYTIHAWIDYFTSWQQDIVKKFNAGLKVTSEILIGINFLEQSVQHRKQKEIKKYLNALKEATSEEDRVKIAKDEKLSLLMRDHYPNKQWLTELDKTFQIIVDPPKARFSTWYEIFPRSFSPQKGKHGTFKDCQQLLPEIARMGFDVLYFPPIHPIGYSKRKGIQNQTPARSSDPGSPWAIGSSEGGHKSVHPMLGSLEDFELLVKKAKGLGIDIALDIALQSSLDHPYIREHPDWFTWRSDGTIQYAENPPKKYEDIVPFYFESEDWKALWIELRSIFIFWIEKGVLIFRVDNPHTKPFNFWEWLITTIKQVYPEVIFLSEAFTRPTVMHWLSKLGFTQSYTYFTWRHTKEELTNYIKEIVLSNVHDYFRPNLWTNTPDILTEELQHGGRSIFIARLILAATLSSNYGMYAPAYELMEQEAIPGTEEYLNSEKYQLKQWKNETDKSLRPIITEINSIRKKYEALQHTANLKFLEIDNDHIISYCKFHRDFEYALLISVNLDPFHAQSGQLSIPLNDLKIGEKGSYKVHELLSNRIHIWEGKTQNIHLDLQMPASIFFIETL